MTKVATQFSKELSVFKKLNFSARSLTKSIFFYQVASTLIFLLANMYMYQKTQRFEAVAIFNLGSFISLIFSYIANAWILRRLPIKIINVIGSLLEGLAVYLILFVNHLTLTTIFEIGLLAGIGMGLYWSTRLFLFTSEIKNSQRDYVSGMTAASAALFAVIVPATIGWFIAFSPSLNIDKLLAYKLLGTVSIILFGLSGITLKRGPSTKSPRITQIFLKNPTSLWQKMRWFILLGSIQFTITVALPESITIAFLGDEAVLGTLFSITGIVAGISLYIVGRISKPQHRLKILTWSLIPLIICSLLMMVLFSKIIIILYLLSLTVFNSFFWYVYFPIMSEVIEAHNSTNIENSYPFFIDHEIMINSGRIVMSLFYLWLVYKLNQTTAISTAMMVGALSQIGLLIVGKAVERGLKTV